MKCQNNRIGIISLTLAAITLMAFASNGIFIRLKTLLNAYSKNIPGEKIYVLTDKNVYKPGERIWFNAYLKSKSNDTNVSSSARIVLYDQYGGLTADRKIQFRSGQCHGFMSIPKSINEGVYLLTVYPGKTLTDSLSSDFYRQIIIKHKVIPGFIFQADLKKAVYKSGGVIKLNLRSFDEFSEPGKNVRYRIDMFDAGKLVGSYSFRNGKNNLNLVSLQLPTYIKDNQIELTIYASSNFSTEYLQISIPIENQGVYVQFFPEGGHLFAGLSNRLGFKIRDWFGNPVQITGKLVNENKLIVGQLKSNRYGTGVVEFIPYAAQKYFLQITSPRYLSGKRFPLPGITPKGIALSLTGIENNLAKFSIRPVRLNHPDGIYLISKSADSVIWIKKTLLSGPVQQTVPGKGLTDFAIFDNEGTLLAQRLFFVEDMDLIITITPDKNEYAPRSKTRLKVKTTNRDGQPVPACIALSVTDAIRMEHDLNEPDIMSYFELYSQLEKPYPEWTWPDNASGWHEEQDLVLLTSFLEKYNWQDIILNHQMHANVSPPKIIREDQLYLYKNNETYYSYRNYTGHIYFLASNPGLTGLNKKQNKKIPYYKKLLENGTPLREVIMVMKPYNIINGGIVFYGMLNSIYFQDGALIILDKQKLGTKASMLDDINPYTIESIRISTQPIDIHEFTALNNVGIIELNTKTKEKKTKEKDKRIFDDSSQKDSVFISPAYAHSKKFGRIRKDYRTTIYWNPDIKTDRNGVAIVSFYNADLRSIVQIIAEGMTAGEHSGTAHASYTVK